MLEAASAREEQRKIDSLRNPNKSLADQHRDDIASGKKKDTGSEAAAGSYSKGRVGEAENPTLDKEKLKAAIAAERKRKAGDQDEAWTASKKAKTDVTEEEMGTLQRRVYSLRCTKASCLCRGLPAYPSIRLRRPYGQLPR